MESGPAARGSMAPGWTERGGIDASATAAGRHAASCAGSRAGPRALGWLLAGRSRPPGRDARRAPRSRRLPRSRRPAKRRTALRARHPRRHWRGSSRSRFHGQDKFRRELEQPGLPRPISRLWRGALDRTYVALASDHLISPSMRQSVARPGHPPGRPDVPRRLESPALTTYQPAIVATSYRSVSRIARSASSVSRRRRPWLRPASAAGCLPASCSTSALSDGGHNVTRWSSTGSAGGWREVFAVLIRARAVRSGLAAVRFRLNDWGWWRWWCAGVCTVRRMPPAAACARTSLPICCCNSDSRWAALSLDVPASGREVPGHPTARVRPSCATLMGHPRG
jgi:hypothetical protein